MEKTIVALHAGTEASYPGSNFDPPERYPEYPFENIRVNASNHIYESVRELFRLLKLDMDHYGAPTWNPLGRLIKKGDKVVIKPNFVMHQHPDGDRCLEATITHGSILRAVVDYVYIAAGKEGRIDIVDCPLDMADLDQALEKSGAREVIDDLKNNKAVPVELTDLRKRRVHWKGGDVRKYDLPGDPAGYVKVDLTSDSELLRGVDAAGLKKYRSTASFFEEKRILEWHNTEHNIYSFSKRVLESDVFINLPKMKTHKKAGVTLNLKNIFGVTDAKDTLPHHRIGRPSQGGDEMPENSTMTMRTKGFFVEKIISNPYGLIFYKMIKPLYNQLRNIGVYGKPEQRDRGEWFGNDTVWRTTLDLNKVLLYADGNGVLHDTPRRTFFSIVDAVVAGEENGPLKPKAAPCGCLIAGDDPAAVDFTCIRLMGIDWKKLPTYANIKNIDKYQPGCVSPDQVRVHSNNPDFDDLMNHAETKFNFKPADGWKGEIEL